VGPAVTILRAGESLDAITVEAASAAVAAGVEC
jgi:hypothetical protein